MVKGFGRINLMNIVDPQVIEKKSMEIIDNLIGDMNYTSGEKQIIKRVIHATADSEMVDLISISPQAVERSLCILQRNVNIVTDVNMVKAGISKQKCQELNLTLNCFISQSEVIDRAEEKGITRSMMAMRKAVKNRDNKIFVIGNAPTALFELINLIRNGEADQVELIIGTPVGFVGAAESKQELKKLEVPYITVNGKRGGSSVAVAITNALLYMI